MMNVQCLVPNELDPPLLPLRSPVQVFPLSNDFFVCIRGSVVIILPSIILQSDQPRSAQISGLISVPNSC
jgi:hypothetical protein